MIEKHPSYNCSSEVPPPAWRRSRQREILVCPPHLHTHTHTPSSFPQTPSSVTHPLFSFAQFHSLPTFLPHTPCPLLRFYPQSPLIKKILTLHETGRLWRVISSISQESAYKGTELTDRRNRIFQFPPSVSLSLSLSSPLLLIPLSLGAFISSLSVFCLVTYFEMLNLPPCFELIIISERVHGPAP